MALRIESVNKDILRQCREQIGLSIAEAAKKVSKIVDFEKGTSKPTFKQLDTLSKLYQIPRWVFICDTIPAEYRFVEKVPVFRHFSERKIGIDVSGDYKVRSLTARVEQLRQFLLSLYEDLEEEPPSFSPPAFETIGEAEIAARHVRQWLVIDEKVSYSFEQWKAILEEKGIFVFLTSKYPGWSHVDKDIFRGLSIYHENLPIIIINDSDAKKAQSFTLFHELGHLFKQESTLDLWSDITSKEDRWFDEFSGNVLMPFTRIRTVVHKIGNLNDVKNEARNFEVSPYAFLVRLRQLSMIGQSDYEQFIEVLKREYRELAKRLKEHPGGPARNMPEEVLKQYGRLYSRTVLQAYHNKEIGLQKLCKLFDLKNPAYAMELEAIV